MTTVSSGGQGTLAWGWEFKLQYHPAARFILQKIREIDKTPYVQIFFWLRDIKELCLKYGIVVCPKSEPTRQMVLGTDNQEKEPPGESLPPMAPELPGAPSLYANVPPYLEASPQKTNMSMSLSWNCRRIRTNSGP